MKSQRRSPRSSFVVTAEIADENSRTVIARVRDLNLYGCYIEMANPLPQGASMTIRVSAGKAGFQARGRVIYSDPNTGSGVEFKALNPIIKPFWKSGCWKLMASTKSTKERSDSIRRNLKVLGCGIDPEVSSIEDRIKQ